MSTSVPLHRLSRRELHRRQVRRVAVMTLSVLLVFLAFGAGYLWRPFQMKSAKTPTKSARIGEEQQAEALRALDDAVRARFEGRWQGAAYAVAAARRADPEVRGVDIFIGEIALEQKAPDSLRQATERSLRSGENEAAAKLLLAMEMWMNRGAKAVDQAVPQATQYLAEAAESEPSNAAAHFFHGELSRLFGNGGEAHRHLRSALYRQSPWHSSALIEVKTQVAAREASDAGKPVVVGSPTAQAEFAFALFEAVRSGGSTASAETGIIATASVLGSMELLRDAELAGDAQESSAHKFREFLETGIPHLQAGIKALQ